MGYLFVFIFPSIAFVILQHGVLALIVLLCRTELRLSGQLPSLILRTKNLSSWWLQRLVDLLEDKPRLPTILQSLGCIAENAIPVFETREEEVVRFVVRNLLKRESVSGANSVPVWVIYGYIFVRALPMNSISSVMVQNNIHFTDNESL